MAITTMPAQTSLFLAAIIEKENKTKCGIDLEGRRGNWEVLDRALFEEEIPSCLNCVALYDYDENYK